MEGIVKYRCTYRRTDLPAIDLSPLQVWRRQLKHRGLVGQHPDLYEGYGYGNLSMRIPPFACEPYERAFVITGTQTGQVEHLGAEHWSVVRRFDPAANRIEAEGPSRPSSEALTHGMLFALDSAIRFVFHVHSASLWRAVGSLGIPMTDPRVPYGSPEMAAEVERLFLDSDLPDRRIFAMGGHEDGLVSFGGSADAAGCILLELLDRIGT